MNKALPFYLDHPIIPWFLFPLKSKTVNRNSHQEPLMEGNLKSPSGPFREFFSTLNDL